MTAETEAQALREVAATRGLARKAAVRFQDIGTRSISTIGSSPSRIQPQGTGDPGCRRNVEAGHRRPESEARGPGRLTLAGHNRRARRRRSFQPAPRRLHGMKARGRSHMSSNPSSGQASRSPSALGPKPSGAELASGHAGSENVGHDGLNEDMNKLRRDVTSLKDSISRLASQASGEAVKTVRNVSEAVASQVGNAASGVADASSDLASSAKDHAKNFSPPSSRAWRGAIHWARLRARWWLASSSE